MAGTDLIEEYIAENPHKPGLADARLTDYGVPVWALIGYLPAANHDPLKVAEDYDVPIEAVQAALEFYQQHRAIIDARIAANHIARVP